MSKAPALPLELLFRITRGMHPTAIGAVINIVENLVARDKPQKPPDAKYPLWSGIRSQQWRWHKKEVTEAANEFIDHYLILWTQKIKISSKHAEHADYARSVLNKLRQPNSKKQQLMMDDSNVSALDIPYTLTPQVFVKSDNIDTKTRSKAIKSRSKRTGQTLFSD